MYISAADISSHARDSDLASVAYMLFVTLACVLPLGVRVAVLGVRAHGHCHARMSRLRMDETAEVATAFWKPPPLDEETIQPGQVVPCTVLEAHEPSGGYLMDIGLSQPALLPRNEVRLLPNQTIGRRDLGRGWAQLEPGEVFEAQVLAPQGGVPITPGMRVNVSVARAQRRIAWQRAKQLADEDVTMEGTILRFSKEGATIDIEGLPAFLPWSHWQLPAERRTPDLYGMSVAVKFLDVDMSRVRLVVSHRRFRLEQAMALLQPGAVVEGTVSSVLEFGATVQLANGLVEGLLHVSQVSELFVRNMSSIVAPGDVIQVVVIKVDPKDGSISLSTKRLEMTPGEIVRNASAVFERVRLRQRGQGAATSSDVDMRLEA